MQLHAKVTLLSQWKANYLYFPHKSITKPYKYFDLFHFILSLEYTTYFIVWDHCWGNLFQLNNYELLRTQLSNSLPFFSHFFPTRKRTAFSRQTARCSRVQSSPGQLSVMLMKTAGLCRNRMILRASSGLKGLVAISAEVTEQKHSFESSHQSNCTCHTLLHSLICCDISITLVSKSQRLKWFTLSVHLFIKL